MDAEDITDFFDDDAGLLDWIYVEDDFPLADELAETQIPDPGYAGTNHEIAMEAFDFDLFDYWEDLQYGEDEYWDEGGPGALAESGQKRKRSNANPNAVAMKRRKVSLLETSGDNVYLVNWATRIRVEKEPAPRVDRKNTFALLPNWRTQFKSDTELVAKKEMPAAMRKAAQSKDEDTPPQQKHFNALAEDEEWEDEEDGGIGPELDLSSLDPEMLKSILKEKLGAAGLEGMDESAFMTTIAKMLSGEEGADGAADDLASSLLGRATEENDSALSGWLSQQGVSFDAAQEADDDASSVATAELPHANGVKEVKKLQASPPDSAIEMLKSNVGETSEVAMHGSSPSASAKKRTAAAIDESGATARKRKRVSFRIPAAAEEVDEPPANGITNVEESNGETRIGHDNPTTEPVDEDDEIVVTQNKKKNAVVVSSNGSTTKTSKRTKQLADIDSQNIMEAEGEEDTIAVAPASAKNTRKRKAEANGDEVAKTAPKPKKQAQGVPARATRSTRAAAKAGK